MGRRHLLRRTVDMRSLMVTRGLLPWANWLTGCVSVGALAIAGLFAGDFTPAQPIFSEFEGRIEPAGMFAVDVADEQAVLDVELRSDFSYRLIVASLGDSSVTHRVRLNSSSIGSAEKRPMVRFVPRFESCLPARSVPCSGTRSAGAPVMRICGAPQCAGAALAHTNGMTDPGDAAKERTFHLHVSDLPLENPAGYVAIRGRRVAEGSGVRIYLDARQSLVDVSPELVTEVQRLMDHVILPKATARFGPIRDVDQDGKLTILLTPWLGQLQGGRTSVNGFVKHTDYRTDLDIPFGNRGDILYLNSRLPENADLACLLAHETTHAIGFSRRADVEEAIARNEERSPASGEEDWLNEAIAHVAENIYGGGWGNLDGRIAQYLNSPERYPLVVSDYYRAGLWRNDGCRGATYLFLRWCIDQYGEELLPGLLSSHSAGIRNLESLTGARFADLFRAWTVAMIVSGTERDSEAPLKWLSLRGKLGREMLCGPCRTVWDVPAEDLALEVRGTAAQYIELKAAGPGSTCRIALRADAGTRLQVTLLRSRKGHLPEQPSGAEERIATVEVAHPR